MGLSPFQSPLSVGHLPQMRQAIFGMRIEQSNRRICPYKMLREGRFGDGLLSCSMEERVRSERTSMN